MFFNKNQKLCESCGRIVRCGGVCKKCSKLASLNSARLWKEVKASKAGYDYVMGACCSPLSADNSNLLDGNDGDNDESYSDKLFDVVTPSPDVRRMMH